MSDELWELVAPLLPNVVRRFGGRGYDHDTYRRLLWQRGLPDIHHALFAPGRCLVCYRRLENTI